MKKILASLAVVGLIASNVVIAHESPAKHGGIVKSADDMSFELVNKDGKTTLYVEDHGKEVPMTGASGTLTVLKGSSKTETALAPGGSNTLVAKDSVKLEAGNKVVASITFADKKSMSVRFSVR
ncbi:hypothetical protein ABT364_19560 [Massilia sp. SR12]